MNLNAARWLTLLAAAALAGCRGPAPPRQATTKPPPVEDRSPPERGGPAEFGAGWKRAAPPRVFEGADLFNHIDGAAELFLELGFRRVVVERYRRAGAELRLDLYEMEDPAGARGLYYHFRGPGEAVPGVAGRNVGNRYQIIMQKGRYFAQVNNFHGDEDRIADMVALANRVWAALPDDEAIEILKLLPDAERVAGSEVIIRGVYTLQTLYTLGAGDVLRLAGQTYGVAADYHAPNGSTFTRLIVPYRDATSARAAYDHLVANLDPHLELLEQDESTIVFRDRDGEYGVATLAGHVLELRLRMTSPDVLGNTHPPRASAARGAGALRFPSWLWGFVAP
jgi:hypothetical protein